MNTPRRRRTRPSSAVLSLLATITHATPLMAPPSFLCPSIDCDNPTPPLKYRKRIQLADKFEQGPDGRWRQVDGYTLYGSTVCSVTFHAPFIFITFILMCIHRTVSPPAPALIMPSDRVSPLPLHLFQGPRRLTNSMLKCLRVGILH